MPHENLGYQVLIRMVKVPFQKDGIAQIIVVIIDSFKEIEGSLELLAITVQMVKVVSIPERNSQTEIKEIRIRIDSISVNVVKAFFTLFKPDNRVGFGVLFLLIVVLDFINKLTLVTY